MSSRGASNGLIELWRHGKFQWIISEDILEEIIEKLVEKGISEEKVEAFILVIRVLALMTNGLYEVEPAKADPGDNTFLAAASEGRAQYPVTLDGHLLSLKQYHGVQIVRPKHLIEILRSESWR